MLKLITSILSPLDPIDPNKIQQIIGYYQNGDVKTPAITNVYAIKQPVYGLEVVISAPMKCWKKEGNVKYKLSEYTVYLTQHESRNSTIDLAEFLIMDYHDFFNVCSYSVPTPTSEANLIRSVVEFSTRTINCSLGDTSEFICC
jgi:hypothetical protein